MSGMIPEGCDFHCHVCGKETTIGQLPPEKTVCEDHCEDHEYEYDAYERWHICIHCNKRIDPDWYRCDDDVYHGFAG